METDTWSLVQVCCRLRQFWLFRSTAQH